MDKNDSCSSGFHHAVKQMPEYLTIRCIDNNHSLNVIPWVSNWGQATANFAPSCAAITISDIKDIKLGTADHQVFVMQSIILNSSS
jgi:hypothetical protein